MENYIEYNGKRVELMLTSKCNINCSHCYISFSGERDIDDLLRMVDVLLKKGYHIKLNGAENLTNLEYLPVYKKCGQTMIMTNGIITYNNPNILFKLKENEIDKLYMSYHFDLHEKISIIPREVIETNIINGSKIGIKSRIMTTISSINYMNIMKMCDEAWRLGANGIAFTNFIETGNAELNKLDYSLTDKMKHEFFCQLMEARDKYDKNTFRIERCGTFGKSEYSDNFCCTSGIDNVTITPDNSVYMCNFLTKPGLEIGVFEDDIIKLQKPICNMQDECVAIKKLNMKGR